MSEPRTISDESVNTESNEIIQDVDYGEPNSALVQINFTPSATADIVHNYFAAVRAITRKLRQFDEPDLNQLLYELNPVLVAEGVHNDVVEILPNPVGFYHVKTVVENGSLFILDLSASAYHSSVATNVASQGGIYASSDAGNTLLAQADSTAVYPGCPDLALVAAPLHTPPGSHVSPRIGITN